METNLEQLVPIIILIAVLAFLVACMAGAVAYRALKAVRQLEKDLCDGLDDINESFDKYEQRTSPRTKDAQAALAHQVQQ